MAIDSYDKRMSMFSLMTPWVPTLPQPDGGFASQADRQHIAYMYRGIAVSVQQNVTKLLGLVGLRPYLSGFVGSRPYLSGFVGSRPHIDGSSGL